MSLYRKPLIRTSITTFFFIVAAIILHQLFSNFYLPVLPALIGFFLFLYLGFALLLLHKKNNKTARFINRFILLTVIKFFLLFIFILFYLILVKTNNVLFLIYVLILYAGYSLATYSAILSSVKNK